MRKTLAPLPPLYPTVHYGLADAVPADLLFFGAGRQALSFLARWLKDASEGIWFVVPAYTCESVIQALVSADVAWEFVDVDAGLDFDLEDLERVLSARPQGKPVLLPTSLFGAPLRDYKGRYPNVWVVEDRSQALADRVSNADFQLLSFGMGKMVSGMGGGALLVRSNDAIRKAYDQLDPMQGVVTAIAASLMLERVVLRWAWRWVQRRMDASSEDASLALTRFEPVFPQSLGSARARWISHSLEVGLHDDRIALADAYERAIPAHERFAIPTGVPYLRYPVRQALNLPGCSLGRMYEKTWRQAEIERGRSLPGATALVQCGLLPTHRLVREEHVRAYCDALR